MDHGTSQQVILDHDRTVAMDLDSKEPGDQRMSEVGVDVKVSAGSGKTSDVKLYMLFQQEAEGYHAYARFRQGQVLTRRGRRNCLRKECGVCLITCNSPPWRQRRCMQKTLERWVQRKRVETTSFS